MCQLGCVYVENNTESELKKIRLLNDITVTTKLTPY